MDSIGGFMGAWNYFQRPAAGLTLTVIEPGALTLEFETERVAIAQAGSTEIVITNFRPAGGVPPRVRLTNAPAGLSHETALDDHGNVVVRLRAAEDLPKKPIEDLYIELDGGGRILSTRPFKVAVFAKEREAITSPQ